MKKKWIWMLLISVLFVLLLVGCKKEGEETSVTEEDIPVTTEADTMPTETETVEAPTVFELALVTDGRTLETGALNQTAWSGLVSFAEENGISHRYYRPAGTETADYCASIDEAAANGAELIVCVGRMFEDAVLEKQTEYPKIDFLLVDGEPREENGSVLKKNAMAVRFQVDQGAYLAGYAAAVNGYTKAGFVGMAEDDNSKRYCYGLLQGLNDGMAQQAGQDGGLKAELTYMYVDKDVTDEEMQDIVKSWSEAGISLIFAGTEQLSSLCARFSQGLNLSVLSTDASLITSYTNVPAAVTVDASACVYAACEQHQNGTFGSGIVFYDMATDSVSLTLKKGNLANFTSETHKAMHEQLASGDIQINNDITVRIGQLDFPYVKAKEEKP